MSSHPVHPAEVQTDAEGTALVGLVQLVLLGHLHQVESLYRPLVACWWLEGWWLVGC